VRCPIKKLLFILFITVELFAQTTAPKREMRAAWLSTVRNIDWPISPGDPTQKKIDDLINYISNLKDANINTVIMQVRDACDAMYDSPIEPWSSWLTGVQGKAPSPYFDPLKIAVEEAHKRGMELHAWLNPYRVRLERYNLALDEKNVAVQHPEWVININGDEMLDPGIPEVREHIVRVIEDIITRYDVDAIHFDDYFYLEGITNQDDSTFAKYPNGYTNKGDWRRNNVNELLRMIYAKIQEVKPRVKFGQSPAGIWKNGVPPGIYGRDNYSVIYCDAVTWLSEQIIDYLAPQLYWSFGGNQDYGKLAPWWASVSNGRHIYPGLAYYRVGQSTFDKTQIGKMVRYNRTNDKIQGEIYFTSKNFIQNLGGITDTLKEVLYKYPALPPVMEWKETNPPDAPANLRFDRVAGLGATGLTWDIPTNEEIKFYVIYRSENSDFSATDIADPKNIFKITSLNYILVDNDFPTTKGYYYVTALDWNNNESGVSNRFEYTPQITKPLVPQLLLPVAGEPHAKDTLKLVWNYSQNANSYSLILATDAGLSDVVISKEAILDTFYAVTGLKGETEYYWSVKAVNLAGESNYAAVNNFTTGFPASPNLLTPLFQEINVELSPTFSWKKNPMATSYRFILAEGRGISSSCTILDTVLTDTSLVVGELKPGAFYAWQVQSINQYGKSLWSTMFQLRTKIILPAVPTLIEPQNNLATLGDTVKFAWQATEYSLKYRLQVSEREDFSTRLYDIQGIVDTFITLSGFKGATDYYWRVRAENNGGSSEFSITNKFSTGFPGGAPVLLYPEDVSLNKELDPVFKWNAVDLADKYHFQLSEGLAIDVNDLLLDTLVTDTTLYYKYKLDVSTIYSWRVKALNSIGETDWAGIFKFKTSQDSLLDAEEKDLALPEKYSLEQNYPNPFNPSTTITFALPKAGMTTLTIYNIIGQKVAVLVSDYLQAGVHTVTFNASSVNGSVTSGLYLYKLQSGEFVSIKKMLLLK